MLFVIEWCTERWRFFCRLIVQVGAIFFIVISLVALDWCVIARTTSHSERFVYKVDLRWMKKLYFVVAGISRFFLCAFNIEPFLPKVASSLT